MDSFRTPLEISSQIWPILHDQKGLAIGSCFAQNIGQWLQHIKFNLQLNPFGIVYNPISIGNQLEQLISKKAFQSNSLISHNGLWQSFDHHSSFSDIDPSQVIQNINNSFLLAKSQLQQADYLILTFGTANIYLHKKSNQIVSNCHKIPAANFEKKRLSVKQILNHLIPIFENLFSSTPNLNIILTVSPVRHLKDGMIENQKSKAVLLLAVDNLVQQFNDAFYFPAYEIMMDDLRDYRFYDKDMIHPNEIAIDYIKKKFADTFFDDNTKSIVGEIEAIQRAVAHRPFQPQSDGHQKFIKSTIDKVELLEKQNDSIDMSVERRGLMEQAR